MSGLWGSALNGKETGHHYNGPPLLGGSSEEPAVRRDGPEACLRHLPAGHASHQQLSSFQ